MKRAAILNGIIGVLIVIFLVELNYSNYKNSILTLMQKPSRVIILDAGHGGMDGGSIGANGTVEKYINLKIVQKLKAYLDLLGYTTLMTREDDSGFDRGQGSIRERYLYDSKARKSYINQCRGDLFISIHLNKFEDEKYYGAQVFYQQGDEVSHRLATILQQQLITDLDNGNHRNEKPSTSYYILKDNGIPSVIVECGFLSNLKEEKLLTDEEYQTGLAFSLFTGINRYFKDTEK